MGKTNNLGHLELIRRINRSLVLNTVKEEQPISRAQIAKRLNLSKTTVSAIVDELLKKRLIVEYGDCPSPAGVGRPSTMLGFNPKSAYCIGADIGGTKLMIIITDLLGEIVYQVKVPTKNHVDELVAIIQGVIQECGLKEDDIFGMGIGVPGTVTADGVVVRAKALHWNNFPLQRIMNQHFSFQVFVGNDVNLAALGERWLGSGDQVDNMLFIALGTGIGSALVCDGQLILGAQGRAGEIGYYLESRDVENGNLNRLGMQGILERKCSGTALGQHGYTAEELFLAYGQGNQQVVQIIDQFIRDFSIAIANSISLLNPSKVVIGGGVSDSMNTVIYRIREEVSQMTPIQADVCLASLGACAGALGAINYAFIQIEQQDIQVQI
ncbi:ROK family transcriptional regulator [Petroclostridium sp. X23]|uniref:ROK family transcriptional regulator n=1 Tax=Petroclostridium sp. X23 TaxID=3045146 RepID=UPI0024AE0BD1|nr:ROK family transcriptional regulator [Petroclostridium sp. X23]WHH56861.1 ROK family transcriptional regulator [Petroclostridium sp. X23]